LSAPEVLYTFSNGGLGHAALSEDHNWKSSVYWKGGNVNGIESVGDTRGLPRTITARTDSESTGVLAAQRKALNDALMVAGRAGSGQVGALATNREALNEALAEAGFVNPVGQWRDNFRMLLNAEAFRMKLAELKPNELAEALSDAANAISENPSQAQQAQAQVPPETAVTLLT
jgi:hypothetical protein